MGRFCGRMAAILVVPIPSVLLPLAKKNAELQPGALTRVDTLLVVN